MAPQRFLAAGLAALLLAGGAPALAQQANGTIAGKATDEAKKPYNDYSIRIRDAATGQIATTTKLEADGKFSANQLPVGARLLVELYQENNNRVVCTEGPYTLAPGSPNKNDVNIDCGKKPSAPWLLAAAAGTAAAVALTTNSASN
jgi:hypothetical protein